MRSFFLRGIDRHLKRRGAGRDGLPDVFTRRECLFQHILEFSAALIVVILAIVAFVLLCAIVEWLAEIVSFCAIGCGLILIGLLMALIASTEG